MREHVEHGTTSASLDCSLHHARTLHNSPTNVSLTRHTIVVALDLVEIIAI